MASGFYYIDLNNERFESSLTKQLTKTEAFEICNNKKSIVLENFIISADGLDATIKSTILNSIDANFVGDNHVIGYGVLFSILHISVSINLTNYVLTITIEGLE